MDPSIDFHDMIVYDLLGRRGDITSRRAMSGWCIYANAIPCGFIIDSRLYLKTKNPDIIAELKKYASEQFSYSKKDGKVITLQIWSVSDVLLDSEEQLHQIVDQVVAEQMQSKK